MKIKQICLIGLAGIILIGCLVKKPLGPLFSPYMIKENEKALVYVYRPLVEKQGYDRPYKLLLNNDIISDLYHGGYDALEVSVGRVSLTVNPTIAGGSLILNAIESIQSKPATVDIDAKKGEVYYVRFTPITHFSYFEPTLALVTESESLQEISKCKLNKNDK